MVKVSEGIEEDGIVIGNAYDKYGSRNFIVKRLMAGFHGALEDYVSRAEPTSIHEVGCGEGYWVLEWNKKNFEARGSDFSKKVIAMARGNASGAGIEDDIFQVRSIYDLQEETDSADLIVCCEVMEHLEAPEEALERLQKVVKGKLILSVPREPLWCAMNLARGKYIGSLGNTPGHIQHWSAGKFIKVVSKYFRVIDVKKPIPWTMLLCEPL